MSEYNPNSIKSTYAQTMADIATLFDKWGIKQWQVRPMREPDRRGHWPSDPARVEIQYELRGETVSLDMAKHPYYYQNIRVLYFALDALRMNEVRGITDIVRQAYGLLTAPKAHRDPHEVLGIRPDTPPVVAEAAYKALAKERHPDAGGSNEAMAELNAAWEAYQRR